VPAESINSTHNFHTFPDRVFQIDFGFLADGIFHMHLSHARKRKESCNLSCRSLSAKEPQIIGLFCRKRFVKIRHPTPLHHPIFLHMMSKQDKVAILPAKELLIIWLFCGKRLRKIRHFIQGGEDP